MDSCAPLRTDRASRVVSIVCVASPCLNRCIRIAALYVRCKRVINILALFVVLKKGLQWKRLDSTAATESPRSVTKKGDAFRGGVCLHFVRTVVSSSCFFVLLFFLLQSMMFSYCITT